MKAPCMGCERRGCGVYHDECPEYQKYRKEKMKEHEQRKLISHRKADFNHLYSVSVRRRNKTR